MPPWGFYTFTQSKGGQTCPPIPTASLAGEKWSKRIKCYPSPCSFAVVSSTQRTMRPTGGTGHLQDHSSLFSVLMSRHVCPGSINRVHFIKTHCQESMTLPSDGRVRVPRKGLQQPVRSCSQADRTQFYALQTPSYGICSTYLARGGDFGLKLRAMNAQGQRVWTMAPHPRR